MKLIIKYKFANVIMNENFKDFYYIYNSLIDFIGSKLFIDSSNSYTIYNRISILIKNILQMRIISMFLCFIY